LQISTSREVALKVPRAGLVGSEKALARFEREVELAAGLKHPNIARIHDTGIHQGIYYYAMDLIEGIHLDEYVRQHNLTIRQILELVQTVCQAVQHAHQNGVIHRDLKPSNVIVTAEGVPYIVDFGLAKNLLADDVVLTVSIDGEVAGTPAYMSPEQAAGYMDRLDTRTDVYSLGVMLFTLLTGEYPHDLSGSRLEVMHRIAAEDVRRPCKICPKIDKELEWLLLKALDNDPDRRYATAGELARDIGNYLLGAPLMAGPESGIYHIKRLVRRHQALVTGIAVVLVVLVAGIAAATLFAVGQARARADAQAVTDFLTDELLAATNPFGGFSEISVVSVLDAASGRLEGKFDKRPLVEAPIRQALGQAYWRHGKFQEAQAHLDQARLIYEKAVGLRCAETLECMFLLGLVYRGQSENDQAQTLFYQVVEGVRHIGGEKDELTFQAMNEIARLGIEQYRNGAYEKALATLTRIEDFHTMLGSEMHVSEIAFLAMALHRLSRDEEARTAFDRFLDLLAGPGGAAADSIFAVPTNLGPTLNTRANEGFPCISADGLSLYFASYRTGGFGEHDLYVAKRETKTAAWGPPMNLGPTINTSSAEMVSHISPDGLSLYFNTDRPGGYAGSWDAWLVTRATLNDDWAELTNLGPTINGPGGAGVTHISVESLTLFFASWDRPGGYGSCDLWMATRQSTGDDWGEPVNVGPPVNTAAAEHCTGVSLDGLTLFLSSGYLGPARPGGAGGGDIWVTTRAALDEPWQEPVNLGPTVNTWADELGPSISADGSTLYFFSGGPGGYGNSDLWQISLVPLTDVNENGQLDIDDLCQLEQRQNQ
ncbi:MAG: protein kinase, partial [Phycisphaerales bacterium]